MTGVKSKWFKSTDQSFQILKLSKTLGTGFPLYSFHIFALSLPSAEVLSVRYFGIEIVSVPYHQHHQTARRTDHLTDHLTLYHCSPYLEKIQYKK